MRAGDAACRPRRADALAARDHIAFRHVAPREVRVERVDAVAVVDDQQIAEKEEAGREGDAARSGGEQRRSHRGGDIKAVMRLSRLAVQHALAAEDAADAALGGAGEAFGEAGQRAVGRARATELLTLGGDAREGRRIGCDLGGGQTGNGLHAPLPARDIEAFLAAIGGDGGALAMVAAEAEGVVAGERDA